MYLIAKEDQKKKLWKKEKQQLEKEKNKKDWMEVWNREHSKSQEVGCEWTGGLMLILFLLLKPINKLPDDTWLLFPMCVKSSVFMSLLSLQVK